MVTIPMPAASLVVAVDQGTERLAGMQQASWVAIRDGILGRIFPSAKAIPHGVATQDFTPNVESIVGLDPDVVVQWSDLGNGLIAPLENAGLTVLGVRNGGTLQDLVAWIRMFGRLLGRDERAAAMTSRLDAARRQIEHEARARASRPTVTYFNRFAGGLRVAGAKTYNDFYLRLVGASNPAAEVTGLAGVDVEQVLAWDPDIVLLGNFDAATPADVYRDPIWRAAAAVRSRRVYKVPLGGYRWDPPGQESPLMWRWLSMVCFPDAPPYDLRGEITREYRFLYDYRPSDEEIDRILWTDLNGASAGYGRFRAG